MRCLILLWVIGISGLSMAYGSSISVTISFLSQVVWNSSFYSTPHLLINHFAQVFFFFGGCSQTMLSGILIEFLVTGIVFTLSYCPWQIKNGRIHSTDVSCSLIFILFFCFFLTMTAKTLKFHGSKWKNQIEE